MVLKNPLLKLGICSVALAVLTTVNSTNAVAQDPPVKVETAFKVQYPAINDVKWARSDNSFVAAFKQQNTQTKASFDSAGNFLESEKEIDVSELPEKVMLYITTQDETAKIYKAYKIEKAERGKEMYDVVAKIHYKKSRITVSRDGYLTSH